VVAVLAVGAYFFATHYHGANHVPDSFIEARTRGGRLAQEITDLSKEVRDDLKKIQGLESAGKFKDAQVILDGIKTDNETIKADTVDLSGHLTTMAKAVADIENTAAQPLAFAAVSTDVEIMDHVVTYNSNLDELIGLLTARFAGKAADRKRIDDLVKQINEEVDTINGLNTQATDKLKQFDDTIRAATASSSEAPTSTK
jgi:uncharacterized protein YeeX (DUF496 family)